MESTNPQDPLAAAEHLLTEAGIDFTVVNICSEACSACTDPRDLANAA